MATRMVNEDFDPGEDVEQVLSVLKSGRANPRHIINETGLEKGEVEYALRRLRDAGWISRPARGLYEFKEDPRE